MNKPPKQGRLFNSKLEFNAVSSKFLGLLEKTSRITQKSIARFIPDEQFRYILENHKNLEKLWEIYNEFPEQCDKAAKRLKREKGIDCPTSLDDLSKCIVESYIMLTDQMLNIKLREEKDISTILATIHACHIHFSFVTNKFPIRDNSMHKARADFIDEAHSFLKKHLNQITRDIKDPKKIADMSNDDLEAIIDTFQFIEITFYQQGSDPLAWHLREAIKKIDDPYIFNPELKMDEYYCLLEAVSDFRLLQKGGFETPQSKQAVVDRFLNNLDFSGHSVHSTELLKYLNVSQKELLDLINGSKSKPFKNSINLFRP